MENQKRPMTKAKKEFIVSIVVLICGIIVTVCGAIMIPNKNDAARISGIVMTCLGALIIVFGIFDTIKNGRQSKLEKAH